MRLNIKGASCAGMLAVALFSFGVLGSAHASPDKDRVLVEVRWYTEADIKAHFSRTDPGVLASVFPKNVTYAYAVDPPRFKRASDNLLKKEVLSKKGDSIRWPAKEPGKVLKTELNAMCISLAAQGLRSLRQRTQQRGFWDTKPIVIAEIETGELAGAPQDLSETLKRNGGDIRVIAPGDEGRIRCNIYKTVKRGETFYNVSVPLRATAAYWRG